MRKLPLPGSDETPDPLPAWKQRHPQEGRLLALLETDWPGGQEIGRRFLRYSPASLSDPQPVDVPSEERLAAALQAYRTLLAEGKVRDRERLWGFLETLAGRSLKQTRAEREALIVRWMPASLARALSLPDEDAA